MFEARKLVEKKTADFSAGSIYIIVLHFCLCLVEIGTKPWQADKSLVSIIQDAKNPIDEKLVQYNLTRINSKCISYLWR